MNQYINRPFYIFISCFVINGLLSSTLLAEPIYHPSGAKLTFGGMTHRRMTVSDMGNPAHPATDLASENGAGRYGIGFSIGVGVEYDAHNRLWELLDDTAEDDALAPGDGGDDDEAGESGPDLPDFPDITDPDLLALIEDMKVKASALGFNLALALGNVNAKAYASADIPILINNDFLGGAWTFGANVSLTTNLKGISEPIDFNSDLALQELIAAYDASKLKDETPTDPVIFDLTGGVSITIDPDGSTHYAFDNSSGTITRAAQISEISIGYSRKIWHNKTNEVYIGIKPKLYSVGLSNTFIFIDSIHNVEDIFDALDGDSFKYTEKISMDAGIIWTGKQYQLGATVTNLNEPNYHFPDVDLSKATNQDVINAIESTQTYTMERQLKLEGGYISKGGAWGINVGLDANAVPDPMLDDYQWLSVGAGFASDSWWLPGVRIGARKNTVGTKLTFITAGVTVFNIVNLDLATTTQTIKVDGQTVPNGLIINIGTQVMF